MISLILATYNGERYVLELLESLLQQIMKPDEIIIVDDCSEDSTTQIVRDFVEHHKLEKVLFLHENDNNMGPTKSFEKAYMLSRYRYVALCDQDDLWYSHKLKMCYDAMTERKVALVYHDAYLIDKNGVNLNIRMAIDHNNSGDCLPPFSVEEATNEYLQGFSRVPGFTMFFDKEYFNDDILPFVDYSHDWWIGALAHVKYQSFYFINMPLCGYRCHSGQASGSGAIMLEHTTHRIKEHNIIIRLKRNIMREVNKVLHHKRYNSNKIKDIEAYEKCRQTAIDYLLQKMNNVSL